MSNIAIPFGKVVQRITIEVDAGGQVRCTAENITPPPPGLNLVAPGVGKRPITSQMDGITLCVILSGVLHSTLRAVQQQIVRNMMGMGQGAEEKPNGAGE